MTWTTPATPIAGTVITTAFWNTNARDNLNQLRSITGGDPGASVGVPLISNGSASGVWTFLPASAMENPMAAHLTFANLKGLYSRSADGSFSWPLIIGDASNKTRVGYPSQPLNLYGTVPTFNDIYTFWHTGNLSASSFCPTGMIAHWGGLISSIPAGWTYLPSSGGRFLMGADNDNLSIALYPPGGFGGATTHTHALPDHLHAMAGHYHDTSIGDHQHIVDVSHTHGIGHTHNVPDQGHTASGTATGSGSAGGSDSNATDAIQGAGDAPKSYARDNHTHSITVTVTVTSVTVSNHTGVVTGGVNTGSTSSMSLTAFFTTLNGAGTASSGSNIGASTTNFVTGSLTSGAGANMPPYMAYPTMIHV